MHNLNYNMRIEVSKYTSPMRCKWGLLCQSSGMLRLSQGADAT